MLHCVENRRMEFLRTTPTRHSIPNSSMRLTNHLIDPSSLRRALRHYEAHCHEERNHQGKDNVLLFPLPTQAVRGEQEKVRCRERLGGLLKYYERKAA